MNTGNYASVALSTFFHKQKNSVSESLFSTLNVNKMFAPNQIREKNSYLTSTSLILSRSKASSEEVLSTMMTDSRQNVDHSLNRILPLLSASASSVQLTGNSSYFQNVSTIGTYPDPFGRYVKGVESGVYNGQNGIFFTVGVSLCFLPESVGIYPMAFRYKSALVILSHTADAIPVDGLFSSKLTSLGLTGRMTFDKTKSRLFLATKDFTDASQVSYFIRLIDFNRQNVSTLIDIQGNRHKVIANNYVSNFDFISVSLSLSGQTLYVSDGLMLYNMTHIAGKSNETFTFNRYTTLDEFYQSKSWSTSSIWITGIVAVTSRNAIFVTIANNINVLMRISMNPSSINDITVLAGDSSRKFDGISFLPSKNGFVGNNPAGATLFFPSHITVDSTEGSLYFVEGALYGVFHVGSRTVRKYSFVNQSVSTYAGHDFSRDSNYSSAGGAPGFWDGMANKAGFGLPVGVTYQYSWHGPVLFVADYDASAVREVYSVSLTQPTLSPSSFPTRTPSSNPSFMPSSFPSTSNSLLLFVTLKSFC